MEDAISQESPFPETHQLQYGDVFRASNTFLVAGEPDPLVRYIRNNRKRSRVEKITSRFTIAAYLVLCIRTKVALTVNQGISNVIAVPPKNESEGKMDPITRFAVWFSKLLGQNRDKLTKDPEEAKRRKEFDDKMQEAVSRTLGERVNQMWYVEGLCTDPNYQGRGYGGAVLDAVTILADLTSQTAWLQSSNIDNTEFYNSHGFVTIETVVVGDQNPKWDGLPVVVSIMVREPKERWEEKIKCDQM